MTDLNQLFERKKISTPTFVRQPTLKTQTLPNIQPRRQLFAQTINQRAYEPQFIKSSSTFTTPLQPSDKQLAKIMAKNEDLAEELRHMRELENKDIIKKTATVGLPWILLAIVSPLPKIMFEIGLLGVALVLSKYDLLQIKKQKSIRMFTQILPLLMYIALFYDVLTYRNCIKGQDIFLANLPILLISIAAGISYLVLGKVSAYIQNANLKRVEVNAKLSQAPGIVYRKYIQRMKSLLQLSTKIAAFAGIMIAIIAIICTLTFPNEPIEMNYFSTLGFTIIVFLAIDLYDYLINFFVKQVHFQQMKKQFYKIDLCMALLRLNSKASEDNQKIQERCLQQVVVRLKKNKEYLDTPVTISYAIRNYKDIFTTYAENKLTELLVQVSKITLKLISNKSLLASTKTMSQDLFIHIRKFYTRLQNSMLILDLVSLTEKQKLIFIILVRLSDQTQLPPKIQDLIKDIAGELTKAKQSQTGFIVGAQKLTEWIEELENLQGLMREYKVGTKVYGLTAKDESGWKHYREKNLQENLNEREVRVL